MTTQQELIHALKRFKSELNKHNEMIKCNAIINQFFLETDKEITITLKANTCASEIIVLVNGEEKQRTNRGFDLHQLISMAILDRR